MIVDVALDEKIFFGAGVHANPTSNSFVEGGTRVRLRNIFGVCDVLNFSWDESTNKDSLLHFEHSFPRLLMGRSASFSINQGVENLAFSSSTSIKSTTASIAMQSLFSKGDNLSLNASLRDVVPTEFDGKVMSRT